MPKQQYRIARYRGKFALVFYDERGDRHRHSLNTDDKGTAERIAPAIYADLTRPSGRDVEAIWKAYVADHSGRAVLKTMEHTWKALKDRFGPMAPENITIADCRAHVDARRNAGIKDGTIHTELGHLRMVLLWGEKHKLVDRAPHIERPSKPKPKDLHLIRQEARRLIDAADFPHVKLFIILALGTGARARALLQLTWDRCDFEREKIDLRNPEITTPHKGRAIVPMNRMVKAALLEAKRMRTNDIYVIEWAGKPIESVKKGLAAAAVKAGLPKVSPHMLRHTAAVHMVEAGRSMEEVAQYLGHNDVEVTRKVYARFSPNHLREAASVLEYDIGSLAPKRASQNAG
ncbi:tyrosine-type recombinase/integrase [Rhodoligotrophos ferricapiens]|uniref:tyrosine-type recombinase/integrase n=1 Tax=Rhodoligotrophos ferricapiens TaxID=3069264 RepID=UPI00315CD09E